MYDNKILTIATLVDPRYKANSKLFDSPASMKSKQWLLEAVQQLPTNDATEPPAKRPRLSVKDDATNPFAYLDDLQDAAPCAASSSADEEVNRYLALPIISRDQDPLNWWRVNADQFPSVSAVARRYLGAPSTSVDSERLFSSASDVYTNDRNRLLPQNAEKLMFIKHNLLKFEGKD